MEKHARHSHVWSSAARLSGWCTWTALAAAACGSPAPTPPTPDPGPANPPIERISGSERLGFAQEAGSAEELSTFGFLIYVDDNPNEAADVSCSSDPGPAGFACTVRMPPMGGGQHTLAVSSYIDSGGQRLESPRSSSITVLLVAQTTSSLEPQLAPADTPFTIATVDGVRLRGEIVADGLVDPTDLAFAPDGRTFVGERAGRIRVVRDGRLEPGPALALSDVSTAAGGGGLLSLAVDPDYARNGFVYAVYTTPRGFRLARFRAVGSTLGDRAILLDDISASAVDAGGLVRFGPDGRLYVGLDDGGDPSRAGDLGSLNGKLLRLNPDGTTPSDQPRGSPIYASSFYAPRSAAWSGLRTLWVLDRSSASEGLLEAVGFERAVISRYRLPEGSNASAIAVYQSDAIGAFRGNLFAAGGDQALWRFTVDAANPATIVASERLQNGALGGARAIGVGPDGAIYICITNAILRLSPL